MTQRTKKDSREEMDEKSVIIRCQKGEKRAFGILVEKYMKRAYFTALGFTSSHEAALDLSQDAFARAYRAINTIDPARKFFTWYYQILRNLCFNYLRDRSRRARPFSEVGEDQLASVIDDSQDTAKQAERDEMRKIVWKALNSLKVREKEIIILKDFQEMSYKEIAESLDIPPGTVMSRLYKARRALKKKLEQEGHFVS